MTIAPHAGLHHQTPTAVDFCLQPIRLTLHSRPDPETHTVVRRPGPANPHAPSWAQGSGLIAPERRGRGSLTYLPAGHPASAPLRLTGAWQSQTSGLYWRRGVTHLHAAPSIKATYIPRGDNTWCGVSEHLNVSLGLHHAATVLGTPQGRELPPYATLPILVACELAALCRDAFNASLDTDFGEQSDLRQWGRPVDRALAEALESDAHRWATQEWASGKWAECEWHALTKAPGGAALIEALGTPEQAAQRYLSERLSLRADGQLDEAVAGDLKIDHARSQRGGVRIKRRGGEVWAAGGLLVGHGEWISSAGQSCADLSCALTCDNWHCGQLSGARWLVVALA